MQSKLLKLIILSFLFSVISTLFVIQPVLAETQSVPNPQITEVRAAILDRAREANTPASQQAQVKHVAIVNGYALADVTYGEGGGQVLLQQQQGSWQVVTGGGGAMDSATLIYYGVPEDVAPQLIQQIQIQWR